MAARRVETVLIVGAGIAGPTLAYWLLRRGFRPTLVERSPRLREGGYMLDFWGIGYDVAERMDVIGKLRAVGYDVREVRLVDSEGRRIGGFSVDLFRSNLSDRFFSLLRGDLAKTIYAEAEGNLEAIFGTSPAEIEQDADAVHVRFDNGTRRTFDLVVGADGLHSTVRNLVFGPHRGFRRYLGYYTASFTSPDYPCRDEGDYVSYAVPGLHAARYALRAGRTGFIFIFAQDAELSVVDHDIDAQRTTLRNRFASAGWECPDMLGALEGADDLYFDSVTQIQMDAWSRGRVALVGDAAFCPSLLAGEGSGFAMAGAYLLAGELGRNAADHTIAFRNYQSAFKPFVDRKQRSAPRFAGWLAPRTRLGLVARREITRLLSVPVLSDWIIRRSFADRFELPAYD